MSCSRDGRPAGGGICHPLRVFPFYGLPVRLIFILGHVDGFRHFGHILSLDRIWFPCALRLRGALERVKRLFGLHGRARVGDRLSRMSSALSASQPCSPSRSMAVQSAPRVLRTVSPIAARVAAFHFLACSRSLAAAIFRCSLSAAACRFSSSSFPSISDTVAMLGPFRLFTDMSPHYMPESVFHAFNGRRVPNPTRRLLEGWETDRGGCLVIIVV